MIVVLFVGIILFIIQMQILQILPHCEACKMTKPSSTPMIDQVKLLHTRNEKVQMMDFVCMDIQDITGMGSVKYM